LVLENFKWQAGEAMGLITGDKAQHQQRVVFEISSEIL
jgi:hypothetical protein